MTFIDDDGNAIEYRGKFAITKQAVSFFNGTIKGDVSITFTIDNNSQNRKTLGYYGGMTLNNVAFTKQAFNRVRNGAMLDRGYIVIQDTDEDSITCFYVSGNANWFQKLQTLITEFNYDKYSVPWTAATISSRSSETSGVIFPMADYWANGKRASDDFVLFMPSDWQTDTPNIFPEIYPAFFLKDLVTETLVQADNIILEGNILDDVLYNSLVVGTHKPAIKRVKTVNDVIFSVSGSNSQAYVSGVPAKFTNFTVADTTDLSGLFVSGTYTANKKTGVYIDMKLVGMNASATDYPMIYKNGVQFYAWNQDMGYGGLSTIVRVEPGDTVELWFLRSSNTTTRVKYFAIIENEWVWPSDWANPKEFLPPISCIDVIKFIVSFFGCSVYFNEYGRVLTITIIEKLKKEDALDLSDNYIRHGEGYEGAAANNYLRWTQAEADTLVKKYNDAHEARFADGNIVTSSNIKDKKDVAGYPFNAFKSDISRKHMVLANVPLITLENGDSFLYDTLNISPTVNIFTTEAGQMNQVNIYSEYIKIVDDGNDFGYFVSAFRSATSTTVAFRAVTQVDEGAVAGQVILQGYMANELFVILSVVNKNVSDFSDVSSIRLYDETFRSKTTIISGSSKVPDATKSVTLTSVPYAVFTKRMFNKPIDQLKNNLAIDNPELLGYTDPTMKELYFNKISRFFNAPKIPAAFLLSEATFKSFNFDRFIYLKTERLTGYFFIESIGNYVDGNTPVSVNLYML